MSYTPEEQEQKIRALRDRIETLEREHAGELDALHDSAVAWRDHARKLELAMEAIEILYRCHDPRQSGHAMDVAKHIAHSASNLPQPKPVPEHELPF